jgi:hypothetical protein
MANRRAVVDRSDLVIKPGGGVVLGPEAALPVAAFGDSLMWGQGLRRQDRFSILFTRGLARQTGQTSQLVFDKSRSGAKIDGTSTERQRFIDTYPALVSGTQAKKTFLESGDESAASALYGEVPSTFPSVRGQVRMLADTLGAQIAVALLDGGVNDVGIEEIVDPRAGSGEFISRFDGEIKTVAYDDVFDLIARVRRKCPKAVIMYFGFFEALSYDSDTEKIRAFMKREFDNDAAWWFNKHVFQAVNVNALIAEAIVRTVWFQSRWQYWTSKAVDDANHDEKLRGPGVVFVPSGFGDDNAVFASNPWLWDDPTDPTADDARNKRVTKIPRVRQLADMENLRGKLLSTSVFSDSTLSAAGKLLRAVDGPAPLRTALRRFASGNRDVVGDLFVALSSEIGRVRHALIASLSHPNRAGASSYANRALSRHRQLLNLQARARKEASQRPGAVPAGGETLDQLLTRCKLRSTGPVVADLSRLNVDSIRLRITTAQDSSDHFIPNVWLVVTTRDKAGTTTPHKFMVNFKYRNIPLPVSNTVGVGKFYPHFEPGTTHRFTIATPGGIQLDEVVGTALLIGADPFAGKGKTGYGTKWIPETVQLEVNGVAVQDLSVRGITFRPGNHLDLQWPAPQPAFDPPKLKEVALKSVKALGLKPPKPSVIVASPKGRGTRVRAAGVRHAAGAGRNVRDTTHGRKRTRGRAGGGR